VYPVGMGFCDHCEGQRFDRARVLRALRKVRKDARARACGADTDAALVAALEAVRALDVPHLLLEGEDDDLIVH